MGVRNRYSCKFQQTGQNIIIILRYNLYLGYRLFVPNNVYYERLNNLFERDRSILNIIMGMLGWVLTLEQQQNFIFTF